MTHARPAAVPLDPDAAEQAALERALDRLSLEVSPRTALLVLTEDAGSATARTFYADALSAGLALANPASFPWCLANAPGATISRRFGITGPNLTWLVESLDAAEAYAPAAAWLDGETAPAILAAVRFGGIGPRLVVWAWSPSSEPVSERLLRADWCAASCLEPV